MTDRKDLKRRVRDRQAHTGESYVTALRQVLAQRPDRIPVVELRDMTELGAQLGMKCRIAILPALADRIDVRSALERFRGVLFGADGHSELALMRSVVLRGERPELPLSVGLFDECADFLVRARAGVGGVSESGRCVALKVEGTSGTEMALFLAATPSSPLMGYPLLVVTSREGASAHPVFDLLERLVERGRYRAE